MRPPAPDVQRVDAELDTILEQWRQASHRAAHLSLLAIALQARQRHPEAHTLAFDWSPEDAHLELLNVRDADGTVIAEGVDVADASLAANLDASNRQVWQPHLHPRMLTVAIDPVIVALSEEDGR